MLRGLVVLLLFQLVGESLVFLGLRGHFCNNTR